MDAPVCIPNIGPRQRRLRRNLGLWALGAAAALTGLLLWGDTPRLARLLLVPLVLGGLVGLLQARGST